MPKNSGSELGSRAFLVQGHLHLEEASRPAWHLGERRQSVGDVRELQAELRGELLVSE